MAAKVTLEELQALYGEVLDLDTIRDIHSECRGLASECYSQLTAISGIEAPTMSGEDTGEGMGSAEPSHVEIDYESALATGEEKAKLEREKELNDLMKRKVEDVSKLYEQDRAFDAAAAAQRALGPQSLRSGGINENSLSGSSHAQQCFKDMLRREREHCGEFVCFYHSYSFVALLYEVQACVARTLYGLPDDFAPTARLLKKPFSGKPHVRVLLEQFKNLQGQDHDPGFREVAISCSLSLGSPSSEAPPMQCFEGGYSCNDLSFHGVMKKLFKDLGADDGKASSLCQAMAAIGTKHQLHGNLFRSEGGGSDSVTNPGHMLQIFIRADCVDDVAYGSLAYGVYQASLNPPSQYMLREQAPDGQARIFWHPSLFLDPSKCKVYHYAANPKNHGSARKSLQKDIEEALAPLLGNVPSALKAFYGIEGRSR